MAAAVAMVVILLEGGWWGEWRWQLRRDNGQVEEKDAVIVGERGRNGDK